MDIEKNFNDAKSLIEKADAIFITAGAGMGVDSGLPDFRGSDGFWREYPKVKELGLSFEDMANPLWFKDDAALAWAFYGHRLQLYRDITPHIGFSKLLDLGNSKKFGSFVFTSNVDGQFQKAGFEDSAVMECHGSIHHLQCVDNCEGMLWDANSVSIEIDNNFRARNTLPSCPFCGEISRPNILMFGDYEWDFTRTNAQRERLVSWMDNVEEKGGKMVVIEIGAGTAVPTVRNTSDKIAKRFNTPLIRINPRESFGAKLEFHMGAVEVLKRL